LSGGSAADDAGAEDVAGGGRAVVVGEALPDRAVPMAGSASIIAVCGAAALWAAAVGGPGGQRGFTVASDSAA